MTRWYCTLDALKSELGDTGTANDARYRRYIANASRAIEDVTGRTFVPVTATKYFDAPTRCPDRLFLEYDDLLSITTLEDQTGTITDDWETVDGGGVRGITTLEDQTSTITAANYWLYPLNMTPKHSIVLDTTTLGRAFEYDDDPEKAITVTGRWGYCEDTVATGLTLGAAIASTTATGIVLSGAGCEVGWTLLVDTEAMFVTNVIGNVATVERGVNGTTAATHLIAAAVSRYVVPVDIEQACIDMALHTNNVRLAGGIREEAIGEYRVSYGTSAAVPAGAQAALRRYRRIGV